MKILTIWFTTNCRFILRAARVTRTIKTPVRTPVDEMEVTNLMFASGFAPTTTLYLEGGKGG